MFMSPLPYNGRKKKNVDGCYVILLHPSDFDVIMVLKTPLYRVFKIFAPPSRAQSRKASVKLTISPSNTFNLKWGRKKLAPETF